MKPHCLLAVSFLAISLQNCKPHAIVVVDSSRFPKTDKTTLCFDLDIPQGLNAGVVIHPPKVDKPEQHSLILPFESSLTQKNPDILVTGASYDGVTLINFITYPDVEAEAAIGLIPLFQQGSDDIFGQEQLPENLYLMESGLKRRFVLNLPPYQNTRKAQEILASLAHDTIGGIDIRLPREAEIFESRPWSERHLSETTIAGAKIRSYPFYRDPTNGARAIDILFQVPPTDSQKAILSFVIKLFGIIITPLVGLGLLTSAKIKRPRARIILLITTCSLEVGIIVFVFWWAFHTKTTADASEITLALIGAVTTVALALIKTDDAP